MVQALLHGMGQLLAYFYSVVPNYGVAIIMLTILVRTAMIPLAMKQAHLMQANRGNAELIRSLQPEVKKIREKYKDDRQRQYEEQKKLYDEAGVNMLGQLNGCLPVLLQMPIFFAMYAVLRGCSSIFGGNSCTPGFHIPKESPLYSAIVDRTASFLGANLETAPAEAFGQSAVSALPYLVLLGVMAVTMWYQTRMMMKLQPAVDPQMAATQKIMRYFPLMFVFFSWNFPAGLILYWSATNTWTIGQQWVLMRKYGEPPAAEDKRKTKPGAAAGGKGGAAAKAPVTKPSGKAPAKANPSSSNASGKKPASGGQKRPAAGSSSARKPAARQARPAKNGAAAASSNSEPANNGADSASAKPAAAGRPKGSGARKGNKGGRK